MSDTITVLASPNIALVKYWGKRGDGSLNLPNNSSVSVTLDANALGTKTSVAIAPELMNDTVYVNGELQAASRENEKASLLSKIMGEMKRMAGVNDSLLVVSNNYFPTGSGLASSASGAAALIYALDGLFNLKMNERELSIMARQVSGSACRSVMGGFVRWHKGELDDGSDSYAEQIAPHSHWDIVDMIGIVSETRKKVSSSEGHSATMRTSSLYAARPAFAEANAAGATAAILGRDFGSLAEIVMRDSNNMHATMLDTWPHIRYMNDKSWEIVDAVHELNDSSGEAIAAYTFDAGPNAHVITTKKHADEVGKVLFETLGADGKVIRAPVGTGPKRLVDAESLITDDSAGHPE